MECPTASGDETVATSSTTSIAMSLCAGTDGSESMNRATKTSPPGSFSDRDSHCSQGGFTLMELIIVVAIIGILAAIVLPNLLNPPVRAREAALKTDLRTIRDAIDQYYGDKGHYPASIEALVEEKYLRSMPRDPFTGTTDSWITETAETTGDEAETDYDDEALDPGIVDIHSGYEGVGSDGTPYSEW
jgi:general secretion pathway protein G